MDALLLSLSIAYRTDNKALASIVWNSDKSCDCLSMRTGPASDPGYPGQPDLGSWTRTRNRGGPNCDPKVKTEEQRRWNGESRNPRSMANASKVDPIQLAADETG